MIKEFNDAKNGFFELVKRIKYYNDAIGVLYWDLRTGAPRKGVPYRAEVIGMLSEEAFRLSTSDAMGEYLAYFDEQDKSSSLDPIMKALVRECRKEYDRYKKIPEAKYKEYVILTSEAESVWEDAKKNNDFEMFKPYLEKIVGYNLQFIELWGYKENKYDTLLDLYEPGMTIEKLDAIFSELRSRIVPLVAKIKESAYQPEDQFLKKYFDIGKQEEFGLYILGKMGYDFDAGRLDESEHPFTTGINPADVRITTHYYPNDLISAVMSSMHEGGHALYEQNISSDLHGTPLCDGASMGLHESQSRFWENIIGRSRSFWGKYYSRLQEFFPEQLKDVPADDFYKAINKVEPSLIRIEADEVTYNLHIMIRYEIEKALINEEIKVADLPEVWKEKMKEYLGIVPPDDSKGVLQDVHWAGGSFGYFPSYTLGNIYSAQIYNAAKKEIKDFEEMVEKGELIKIKDWLAEKIHKHGKVLKPEEILLQVTGEGINPKYLIDYLEKKYKEIYKLEF
ncbi:MAG TPA: carboxypeptidase M32 [Bacillota bacterium]|nr:carboxypeptidase M32 [Bacillota bacterium]